MTIIYAAIVVGGLGLLFGLILAFASRVFHVEVDPKIEKIDEILPSANCGACGYAGCAAYAEAVVKKDEDITLCAPGGDSTIEGISKIMGISASGKEKEIAVIHCQSGGKNNTFYRYDYQGISTCKAAVEISQGPNLCNYGCVFQYDCVEACSFDALVIGENGQPKVIEEKCVGCNACVVACPRNLIELVKESKKVHILCSSLDKGAEAKKRCGNETACIACGICVRKCPVDAIEIKDNLAILDYEKCINCGECAKGCPTKAIEDQLKGKRKKAHIIEAGCIGCTICKKKCPVDAIEGELKEKHKIISDKCIGCEICVEACPKDTIEMV